VGVVNCFQIVILHRCFTSTMSATNPPVLLWIAFKLLSYIGVSQVMPKLIKVFSSCELLSNCYLTSVFHKYNIGCIFRLSVVNCFQIVILHRCFTSFSTWIIDTRKLWIAFKLLSYIGVSQVCLVIDINIPCCELLSNCYLTSVFHKEVDLKPINGEVVNCFQIVILHRCFTRL